MEDKKLFTHPLGEALKKKKIPDKDSKKDKKKVEKEPKGPINILIVEDEKPIASVLKIKLEKAGYLADIAYNGNEAIEKIGSGKFSLVLLDLVMPDLNGFEVLEHLQKTDNKTQVVVTSNLSQDEDIKKAKLLGASDYFVKSNMSLSDIVESLKQFI